MQLRLRRSSLGVARTGWVIGAVVVASLGCSDGRTSLTSPEPDAGASSETANSSDTNLGETTETTDGQLSATTTVGGSGETSTMDPSTSDEFSSGADAGELSTGTDVGTVASGTTSDATLSSGLTSDELTDTSDDPIPNDGAIDPPDDMVVVANFNAEQGFNDGQGTLAANVTRFYAQSQMSLEIPFTSGGGGNQQYGVNFNTAAVFCGHDLVARVRLVSGFNTTANAPGGIQLRVWSNAWAQFASRWTAVSGVGEGNQLGQWLEYRFPWTVAATQNPNLNLDQLNGVGIAFISGGAGSDVYSTAHFDVDWIGFVPSEDACPIDTGSTSGEVDSGVSDTSVEVDSGVMETSVEVDSGVSNTSEMNSAVDAGPDAGSADVGDASADAAG